MAESATTDLFKFIAIRPGQRVTEKETRYSVIRDPRVSNSDDEIRLTRIARHLSSQEGALSEWNQLDLSDLKQLEEGYRGILRHYEQLDTSDKLPDVKKLLLKHGITKILDGREEELLEKAWDALLIAESTGPDAGLRLETPMAALRTIHFVKLFDEDEEPQLNTILGALHARPAIPNAFHTAFSEFITQKSNTKMTEHSNHDPFMRGDRLRELATELHETERLLDAVRTAPTDTSPAVKETKTENLGEFSRSHFTLSSVPSLRSVLSDQLTSVQLGILDKLHVTEETPIFAASNLLEDHLSKLKEQSRELANDPEFQSYVKERRHPATDGNQNLLIDMQTADSNSVPDVDVSGRIVPLGIGDLKVVKQTLLQYVPGEVAHIENVLKGESKERKHRKLDRTETTLFTSEEETKENERDTQSTDRFELKREVEQTIKEDLSLKAGLTVTSSFGPVITTATGDLAYSTSKQESQKNSSNFAREVVDRSVSRVQIKTRIERTTKTLNEVEEINTHGVNNVQGKGHVIGIYRWVDKRYRAQIFNYGVRLLLEFIVPEPAAFFRAAQSHRHTVKVNAKPPEPFLNLSGGLLTVSDINETDYLKYMSRYNAAGVTPPPPEWTFTGVTLAKDIEVGKSMSMTSKELIVPEGYKLHSYSGTVTAVWKYHPKLTLQVGHDHYPILNKDPGKGQDIYNSTVGNPNEIKLITGSIPVSVAAYDVTSFGINVQGAYVRTKEHYDKWRIQTFEKIYTAYQALQAAYDQKVTEAEAATTENDIQGRNPAMNRVTEKTELKKLCITMMTGQHFQQFDAMSDPENQPEQHPEINVYEALNEGPIVQFFEQAFEWEQMTYLFYPYFWTRKKKWVSLNKISDPDPLFQQFLTAGHARVVVPVPMAYVDAVLYLLQSKETDLSKKIWRGGERPTLDSDLYVSITEEMRNQTDDIAGAKPEGAPWEFSLPTTLVWIQPDSSLPSFCVSLEDSNGEFNR
ncbi:hypothetical protein G5B47_17480 [Paenibacillus sp. 7124]|uniref:Uncharacterized protein n=1 Tax=Paenibacillus apii TaxID=1850370 RepID=A0A6M1PKQ7_9BACL|nr:hypothetical protein [Paenibacillus apii]NGM84207.1 hypothetical protein [Paenibacillus apii]NJJ40897.1 hypothetical protein [Paenibacillus apii]